MVKTKLLQIALLLCATVLFTPFAQAQRYALLIGVSEYKDENISDLEGPKNDVSALASIIQSKWGFNSSNIVKLVNEKATRSNILQALKSLQTSSRSGDYIFIYYSGHGTSKKDVNNRWPMPYGTGALVPYDFLVKGTPKDMMKELIVGRTDLRPILENLDKGRNIFVVIDACYAGQSVRGLSLPKRVVELDSRDAFGDIDDIGGGSSFSEKSTKKEAYPYKNVVYLSSSGEHETASDISSAKLRQFPTFDGKPHGAFTNTFLQVLNGSLNADYNNNGRLDYDEVYRRVREEMATVGYKHTPNRLPEISEDKNQIRERPFLQTGVIDSSTGFAGNVPGQTLGIIVENLPQLSFVGQQIKKYEKLQLVKSKPDIKIGYRKGEAIFFNPSGDIVAHFLLPTDKTEFFGRLLQQYWIKHFIKKQNPKQKFNVTLDLTGDVTGSTAIVGDKVAFSIQAEKPAYIVLLDIDSHGNVNVLYPYDIGETNILAAKQVLSVPGNTPDDMIVIEPPFGVDRVIALAFTRKPRLLNKIMGKSVAIDSPQIRQIDSLVSKPSANWAKSYLTLSTFDKPRK